jgi:hypothetical protein
MCYRNDIIIIASIFCFVYNNPESNSIYPQYCTVPLAGIVKKIAIEYNPNSGENAIRFFFARRAPCSQN